jgi:hypothetical protein
MAFIESLPGIFFQVTRPARGEAQGGRQAAVLEAMKSTYPQIKGLSMAK